MPEPLHIVMVSDRPKTELQKFASWFHQDCALVFSDFDEGARMYVSSLSKERRAMLRTELSAFAASISSARRASAMRRWGKLGAQAWPSEKDIRQALGDLARDL